MKKFVWGCVAVVLAATGFTVAAPGASALVVGDVAAAVGGRPAKVSPPGGLVLYSASATNNGPIAIDVVLTDTWDAGSLVSVSEPGCTGGGTSVTCSIAQLASGQTFTVDIVVRTPTSPTTITNTASVGSNLDVDLTPENNSSSVNTPVVNDPGTSMAFVPGGGSLTYKTHTMYIPASSPGVFAIMNDALVAPNTPCGDGTICGPGVHFDFVQDDHYNALDPNDPIRFAAAFPNEDPCHGRGNPECVGVAYRITQSGPATRVPFCEGASSSTTGTGRAVPAPCVNKVTKHATSGTKYTYDVLLLSNDPDLLPPVRLG